MTVYDQLPGLSGWRTRWGYHNSHPCKTHPPQQVRHKTIPKKLPSRKTFLKKCIFQSISFNLCVQGRVDIFRNHALKQALTSGFVNISLSPDIPLARECFACPSVLNKAITGFPNPDFIVYILLPPSTRSQLHCDWNLPQAFAMQVDLQLVRHVYGAFHIMASVCG